MFHRVYLELSTNRNRFRQRSEVSPDQNRTGNQLKHKKRITKNIPRGQQSGQHKPPTNQNRASSFHLPKDVSKNTFQESSNLGSINPPTNQNRASSFHLPKDVSKKVELPSHKKKSNRIESIVHSLNLQ